MRWITLVGLVAGFLSPSSPLPQSFTGRIPLTDLGTGVYRGMMGGLYADGSNERPWAHETAGLVIADQIVPRNPLGSPDPTLGIIGMASVGMSNTQYEFAPFIDMAVLDPAVNRRLRFVNGAEPSNTVDLWANPNHPIWTLFALKLAAVGVAPLQLQVVWVKLAAPSSVLPGAFAERTNQERTWLAQTLRTLKTRYPNVRIAYLSSRIYGGYALSSLGTEPYSYENGFSVKKVVQAQIDGDPDLDYSGPDAKAPWLSWGPYLWADGLGWDQKVGGVAGRSDGLEWRRADFEPDGIHPSMAGRIKVATRLHQWLKSDITASSWYLASPPPVCGMLGLEPVAFFVILLLIRAWRGAPARIARTTRTHAT